jgi:hypothetical protein
MSSNVPITLISKAVLFCGSGVSIRFPAWGGKIVIARACAVTPQAVARWLKNGHLPRTELTGETKYAAAIAKVTQFKVKEAALLRETKFCFSQKLTQRAA